MEELKKNITRLLREIYTDVFFHNAPDSKKKYLVFDLSTIETNSAVETFEMQIDIWDKSSSYKWIDETYTKLVQKLSRYHELNKYHHITISYERTLPETTENSEWRKYTVMFYVRYTKTERN